MKRCINCLINIDDHLTQCPHCGYVEGANMQDYCHLPPRTVLNGRYTIGRPLGCGGFGVTYIAWDSNLGTRVAIKEYLPGELAKRTAGTQVIMVNQATNNVFIDGKNSFLQEAQRIAQLGAIPGVAQIFEYFEHAGTAYIVMEYLEGETLLSRLERSKNNRMHWKECVPIMLKVLETLEKIHASGIIHRDIAPDNIMLCNDGRVVLIDFGAARHMTTRYSSRSLSTVLKIGYAPPEQYYKDSDQQSWTDVYAAGATMYRALTGEIPMDSYTRAREDTMPSPASFVRIPKYIEIAILNAMNITIEKRTQTAQIFADELSRKKKAERIVDKIRQTKVGVSVRTKAMLVCAAAAAVIVSALLLFGIPRLIVPGTKASVPDGMSRVPAIQSISISEAESILSDCDLRLRISDLVHDDYFDRDIVLYQNPGAGSVAYIGSIVDATVSAPEETVTVPDVTGYELSAGADMLEQLGFVIVTREENNDFAAPGSIIYQSVHPNETAKPGTVIELVVSIGPENSSIDATVQVEAPSVIGMTFEEAQQLLLTHNLYITKTASEYSATVPAGQIIRQSPLNGETVNQGSTIQVVVSAGNETVVVPDLRYMTESAARARASAVKLNIAVYYETSMTVSAGLVIRQDVSPEITLAPNSTISVWVSTGYQVSVPNCVGKNQDAAIAALSAARLACSVTNQSSSAIPAGQVISQSIAAGQSVEQGTTVTLVVSSGKSTVAVTGVTVSPSRLTMNIGDNSTLIAAVNPSNASTGTVAWRSDNTAVAQVDAGGTVTAVGVGTATITATTTDGGKTASCTVTVTKTLSYISVTAPSKTVYYLGDSFSKSGLAVRAVYNDGSTADITSKCTLGGFDSSSAGTKNVTVSYSEGGITRNDSFSVVVSAPLLSYITMNSAPSKTSYYVGEDIDISGLRVTAAYTNGATADVTGRCTFYGFDNLVEGMQTVTVSYNEGSISKSESYNVSFTMPSITLSQSHASLKAGETLTLTASIDPFGQTLTWSSTNSAVASVSDGVVTTGSAGSATVTAGFSYCGRNYTASCEVTVNEIVVNPSISISTDLLESEGRLYAVTSPANAEVSWISDDTSTIVAASDGRLEAKRTGVTTITASITYNGATYTDTQEVTAYLLGDIDFDSAITEKDVNALVECALRLEDESPLTAEYVNGLVANVGDVNSDGEITTNDVMQAQYMMNGQQGLACTYKLLPTNTLHSFKYSVNGSRATITGYTGSDSVLIVPSVIDGYTVTSVGVQAFYDNRTITAAVIPNSVTEIANNIFLYCRNLKTVSISNNVKSIGNYAFGECNSLVWVTIPESTETIGDYVFSNCSKITEVSIPGRMASIGRGAFEACDSLTDIRVDSSNQNFRSINGVLFNRDATKLLQFPAGKVGEYSVPDGVTTIDQEAFSGCTGITKVTLPNSAAFILYNAFFDCKSLTAIELPTHMTRIETQAFAQCSGLTEIVIPQGITVIATGTFNGCKSLSKVELADTVTSIENNAFMNCSALSSIRIPASVNAISIAAFSGSCSLNTIYCNSESYAYQYAVENGYAIGA